MRETQNAASHPDDGDLVRYLDHQLSHEERRALLAHVSECASCNDRLAGLRADADAVSAYLGSIGEAAAADQMTRARALATARQAASRRSLSGRSQHWARAAAVAGIVALGAYTVEPVRAWVRDGVGLLFGGGPASPVAEIASGAVLERGSRVAFHPMNDVFVLEIEHLQSAGAVMIEVRDQVQATAQVLNARDETILVLPGGLRVENAPGSEAIYSVTLPDRFRLIQVFAGGIPVAILPTEGRDAPWSITVPIDAAANRR